MKDEIACLDEASDFPDFLLIDDFYQLYHLKHTINKKCLKYGKLTKEEENFDLNLPNPFTIIKYLIILKLFFHSKICNKNYYIRSIL